MTEPITWSFEGGLAELVLNAPEKLNAMDLATTDAFNAAADAIAALDGLRVVLIRAEGKHFCVGGDLKSFDAQGDAVGGYLQQMTEGLHAGAEVIRSLPVPVITAAQGSIAGAGVSLALSGDLVLLADTASITLAYTAVGLSPDNGSTWLLPRLMGERLALDLMLTNRRVKAPELYALGLATQVVAAYDLLETARALAASLIAGSGDAQVAAKMLVRSSLTASFHDQLAAETASISALSVGAFAREAVHNFGQK